VRIRAERDAERSTDAHANCKEADASPRKALAWRCPSLLAFRRNHADLLLVPSPIMAYRRGGAEPRLHEAHVGKAAGRTRRHRLDAPPDDRTRRHGAVAKRFSCSGSAARWQREAQAVKTFSGEKLKTVDKNASCLDNKVMLATSAVTLWLDEIAEAGVSIYGSRIPRSTKAVIEKIERVVEKTLGNAYHTEFMDPSDRAHDVGDYSDSQSVPSRVSFVFALYAIPFALAGVLTVFVPRRNEAPG
jgi:hypothetical protein